MYHNFRKILSVSCICLFLSVFFMFPDGKAGYPDTQNQNSASLFLDTETSMDDVHLTSIESSDTILIQRLRNAAQRNMTPATFLIFFMPMAFFSLWPSLRRFFFVYLKSCLYFSIRSLHDLLIQQKEDGKKRLPVF